MQLPERAAQASGSEPAIRASDLEGLKFFKKIRPLLDSLHHLGTARDRAANRDLHMDQYGVLVLMWMFNPILTSLRGLRQASRLQDVQKKSGVGRTSLGSLSESVTIFDPEPLKQIAATLATEVPSADPSKFGVIGRQLTAVDGSVFKTAVRVASLAWLPAKGNGKNKSTPLDGYRMHTHFEVLRGVPERIDATPAKPGGKDDERAVLASVLKPDCCHVVDRGDVKFESIATLFWARTRATRRRFRRIIRCALSKLKCRPMFAPAREALAVTVGCVLSPT